MTLASFSGETMFGLFNKNLKVFLLIYFVFAFTIWLKEPLT